MSGGASMGPVEAGASQRRRHANGATGPTLVHDGVAMLVSSASCSRRPCSAASGRAGGAPATTQATFTTAMDCLVDLGTVCATPRRPSHERHDGRGPARPCHLEQLCGTVARRLIRVHVVPKLREEPTRRCQPSTTTNREGFSGSEGSTGRDHHPYPAPPSSGSGAVTRNGRNGTPIWNAVVSCPPRRQTRRCIGTSSRLREIGSKRRANGRDGLAVCRT